MIALDFTFSAGAGVSFPSSVTVTLSRIAFSSAFFPYAWFSVPPLALYLSLSGVVNVNGSPITGFCAFGLYATRTTSVPSGTTFALTSKEKFPATRSSNEIFVVPYSCSLYVFLSLSYP